MKENIINQDRSSASRSRHPLMRTVALTAVMLAGAGAGAAHAEAGSRVCGVMSKSSSHPSENVAFVMKVGKGDNSRCNAALDSALAKFNAVGGTTNTAGLNRIWRRVRGGSVGPFAGKSVYSQSFSLTTCEKFTWYVSEADGDYCNRLQKNKLYATAAASGEFALRGE